MELRERCMASERCRVSVRIRMLVVSVEIDCPPTHTPPRKYHGANGATPTATLRTRRIGLVVANESTLERARVPLVSNERASRYTHTPRNVPRALPQAPVRLPQQSSRGSVDSRATTTPYSLELYLSPRCVAWKRAEATNATRGCRKKTREITRYREVRSARGGEETTNDENELSRGFSLLGSVPSSTFACSPPLARTRSLLRPSSRGL